MVDISPKPICHLSPSLSRKTTAKANRPDTNSAQVKNDSQRQAVRSAAETMSDPPEEVAAEPAMLPGSLTETAQSRPRAAHSADLDLPPKALFVGLRRHVQVDQVSDPTAIIFKESSSTPYWVSTKCSAVFPRAGSSVAQRESQAEAPRRSRA